MTIHATYYDTHGKVQYDDAAINRGRYVAWPRALEHAFNFRSWIVHGLYMEPSMVILRLTPHETILIVVSFRECLMIRTIVRAAAKYKAPSKQCMRK